MLFDHAREAPLKSVAFFLKSRAKREAPEEDLIRSIAKHHVKVENFTSEAALLTAFGRFLNSNKVAVLCHFNGSAFDVPYVARRSNGILQGGTSLTFCGHRAQVMFKPEPPKRGFKAKSRREFIREMTGEESTDNEEVEDVTTHTLTQFRKCNNLLFDRFSNVDVMHLHDRQRGIKLNDLAKKLLNKEKN